MISADAWDEYDRWNEALAARMFGPQNRDVPAYVEVDAQILADCAADLGVDGDALDGLVDAVRGTLIFRTGHKVFTQHSARHQVWRRMNLSGGPTAKRDVNEIEVPPTLALLTLLVVAATRMAADAQNVAHAYYPRLTELLQLQEWQAKRLREDFPSTEVYWRGLNEYLESNEGRAGLPTAYSLGHRYVGIPQSQALVRAMDRARLPGLFRMFGLVPGAEMIPADLEPILDIWIGLHPCPVSTNLRNLWNGRARDRIAGVVAVELALWDGSIKTVDVDSDGAGQLQLTALVRQRFGSRSLELAFAARLPRATEALVLEVATAEGRPAVAVLPAAGGRLVPKPGSRFDASSLAGAMLELHHEASGQSVRRRPRRVVPMRRDELLGFAIEVDRVQLAEDVLLLVKDEEKLLAEVLDVLDRYGRRGVVRGANDGEVSGVPDGWVMIEDAVLYAVPKDVRRLDLNVLVPLATAQMTFAGGLRLPGRIRKWSSLRPPEIRAAVADAETVSIVARTLDDDSEEVGRWSAAGGAVVVPLGQESLEDGDYEIELHVNGSAVSVSTLRLRSGDTPDAVTWETCARLNYELDSTFVGALTASVASEASELFVDGAEAVGHHTPAIPLVPAPSGIGWSSTKTTTASVQPVVVLGRADPAACVMTGRHYIELPTWFGEKARGQIQGVCRDCGLRKTLPARPRWKSSKEQELRQEPTAHDFAHLPTHADLGVEWDTCLDALVHVGGGAMASLERVASQAEGSSLFADQFVRTLEGLGHIDVRRDETGRPAEWEANPAYLAETCDGDFVLTGVWTPSGRALLDELVTSRGGTMTREERPHEISTWRVGGVSGADLEQLVEDAELSAYVIADCVERMLEVLPPLSSSLAGLSRTPMPNYAKSSIFDTHVASWRPVPAVGGAGAYRLEQNFRTITAWVDAKGAADRTVQIASIQTVKHLAALAEHRTLIAHLPTSSRLVVPLGADLPGLYGRVAMLCSGRPPTASRRARALGYGSVPTSVADRINTLLAN